MDAELFELCKEVVERTEWGGTDYFYCSGNITHRTLMDDDDFLGEVVPLYTSDYLLEKLPKELHKDEKIHYLSLSAKYGDEFKANYISPTGYLYLFLEPESDTPLKALLKLVIALDNANELPKLTTPTRV